MIEIHLMEWIIICRWGDVHRSTRVLWAKTIRNRSSEVHKSATEAI